jgi:hypothetical protein
MYSDERFAKKLFELLGFGKLQTLMTPSHFFALVNRNLFLKSLQSRKHLGDRAAVRKDREKVEKEEKVSKRRRFNNPVLPYCVLESMQLTETVLSLYSKYLCEKSQYYLLVPR